MKDPEPGPPLRQAQQRLSRLIRAPSGAASETEALLRGDALRPAPLRLEVYARAWFERLHGALAGDFAVLARAAGAEAFRALVLAYLAAHPPRSPSLRDAGDRFAEFVARAPEAGELRRRLPFAPDLARLEWALVEAFDAADAPVLARETLEQLPAERWAELRFVLQPALRRLAARFPVERLRLAHDRGGAELLLELAPQPTQLCVWRAQERVFYRALAVDEAEALALAADGASFGELCELLAAHMPESEAPLRAASLLERWRTDEWLAALAAC
jgi:hypothetical protein